jgi:hypothetical protein
MWINLWKKSREKKSTSIAMQEKAGGNHTDRIGITLLDSGTANRLISSQVHR